MRSVRFSKFSLQDEKEFKLLYSEITKYFQIASPIFDPLQSNLQEIILVTPHTFTIKEIYN